MALSAAAAVASLPAINILNTGALIQSFHISPTRNIVLGFNTEASYIEGDDPNPAHFGATIGRVANRIKDHHVTLSDQVWELSQNDGENTLHGGKTGWGKQQWEGPITVRKGGKKEKSVKYKYHSPHLDNGFPGAVDASVAYTVSVRGGRTRVEMEFEAKLVGGSNETTVSMTNHSYFNLSGNSTISGTEVILATTEYLPISSDGIPLSTATANYPGLKANTPFVLGDTEPDVDDCFVFPNDKPQIDTRGRKLRKIAGFYHPESKVHLLVESTEPAFQFYTGKFLDIPAKEDGSPAFVKRGGFCVEPSRYVDAASHEEWRPQVLLRKGEVYGSRMVYTAWEGGKDGVEL